MQVRYARESHKVQPSSDPNDNNQLFFAKAPLTATEDDIKAVFDEFGEVGGSDIARQLLWLWPLYLAHSKADT